MSDKTQVGPFDNDGHNKYGYDENGEHDENKQTDFEPEGGEPEEDTYVIPDTYYVAPEVPDEVPYFE